VLKPPHSLQGRLLALVLGLVVSVWLATAALTWFDVRHELDELLDGHLAQAAALLVVQQARAVSDDDDAEHDGHGVEDAPTLHRYAPTVAFQVFHEGRLGLRSANAPVWPMAGPAAPTPTRSEFQPGFTTVQLDGVAWRVFSTQGADRDVQVFVGEQVPSRAAILWAVMRSTLWPMLVALPLLALAVWWAVRRGVAPLRRLGRTLAERSPQGLTPVALAGAPSEMAPMLDALNGLFRRIEELMESERRFTADAAHELRTPIAAIRAQAQVALGEPDDASRRHALQATLAGCDRATRLVEQLLTLARLEASATTAASALDLSTVVRRVVAELAPQALQKQQGIGVDAREPCPVHADATLLAVLVRNLVDNAIRYSPAQARVRVTVSKVASGVQLKVEDSGPAMSEPELKRLGERFFRVLGSGQGGSGLGWSIVRRIAAVQQARVHVSRCVDLGGLAVWVEWPAQ
jgi:two-component system, OmpR family, sensor histidine kinase QseC